jgi:hypothetical protein
MAQAPGWIVVPTIQLQLESSGKRTSFRSSSWPRPLASSRSSSALQDGQSGSNTSTAGTPLPPGSVSITLYGSSGFLSSPHVPTNFEKLGAASA